MTKEFSSWIGRRTWIEDEISLAAVRRIAATFDLEPGAFVKGTEIPSHWYSMFFTLNAKQSQIGPDGHPEKGEFLPPIALPRRMFVGREVKFPGIMRVGGAGTKSSVIESIVPKSGRTGDLVFVTVQHTIDIEGCTVVEESQRLVYREAAKPGQSSPAGEVAAVLPPPAWQEECTVDATLLFRYSAITWNAHRIHYDADYSRSAEGYPGCVINGALTLHLLTDAVLRHHPGRLRSAQARLSKPLFLGEPMMLAGSSRENGRIAGWALNREGHLAAQVELEIAP